MVRVTAVIGEVMPIFWVISTDNAYQIYRYIGGKDYYELEDMEKSFILL